MDDSKFFIPFNSILIIWTLLHSEWPKNSIEICLFWKQQCDDNGMVIKVKFSWILFLLWTIQSLMGYKLGTTCTASQHLTYCDTNTSDHYKISITCLQPRITGIIHSGSVAWVLSSINTERNCILASRGSPAPTHVQQITSVCWNKYRIVTSLTVFERRQPREGRNYHKLQ